MDKSQQIYRITYEAFSQFSSRLLQINTLDELRICLQSRTKYLFDFKHIRISSHYHGRWIHMEYSNTSSMAHTSEKPLLMDHEKTLIQRGIPMQWTHSQVPDFAPGLCADDGPYAVYGWHLQGTEDNSITLSLATQAHHAFGESRVPIIKLYIEVIEAKLLQILLYNQVAEKNEELSLALHTIREKNAEINAIMEQQDTVIAQQTQHLEQQNNHLRQIAVLNAHQVREPLARVLGLAKIAPYYESAELKTEILPKIQQSSDELDQALKEVIHMAEKPLSKTEKKA